MPSLLGAIALAAAVGVAHGYWRLPCGIIQTGRIDPIISPGGISNHVHKLSGGSSLDFTSDYYSLRNSTCTSCEIQADKSGYWTPQLYYQHKNGSFEEVPANGMVVYYLGRGDNRNNSVPFPPGFRMLSGNMLARSYDNATMTYGNATHPPRPVSDRVSFNCLDTGPPLAEQPYLFRTQCANGLRAQIQFQSCWDGVNLYLPDQSHVAYMSQIDNGVCPPTHPVQLVHLFYEVLYGVAQIDQTDGGRFVFAQGDPTGYGFHGDFLNGWDMNVLTAATQQCANTDNNGLISACAPFNGYDSYDSSSDNCPEQPPIVQEKVHGMIGTALPGCNPVQPGPAAATIVTTCTTPAPAVNTPPPQTPVSVVYPTPSQAVGNPGWKFVDCYNDGINNTRTLSGLSYSNSSNTVELCQSFCRGNGYRFAGVEYSQECYCGATISTLASGGQIACSRICANNSAEICGGSNRISIFNNTLYNASSTYLPGAGPTPAAAGQYLGCASDQGSGGRALNGASYSDTSNMTLESCRAYCDARGYQLSGTEYSSECYCGNYLVNGGILLPSNSSCGMVCSGSRAETCGGPNRLSVFNSTQSIFPATGGAKSSGPSAAAGVYVGCVTDPNSNGRALSGSAYASASNMTLENCRAFCDSGGYFLSGAEYGRECYCGNSITNGGIILATGSSCNMACTNSSYEFCGGPNRLSVFNNTKITRMTAAAGRYLGCWTEPPDVGTRALTGASYTSSTNMTLESCRSFCDAKGFALSGTEYSSECYCGSTMPPSASRLSSDASCSMQCSGAAQEFCGGSRLLSVFNSTALFHMDLLASPTPTAGGMALATEHNTPTPMSSTPAAGASAPAVPSSTAPAAGIYLSCVRSSASTFALKGPSASSNTSMTLPSCRKFCDYTGYLLSGTSNGTNCFCGNKLDDTAKLVADSSCNVPCSGDPSQDCGGPGLYLSVYNTTGIFPQRLGAYTFQGCYKERPNAPPALRAFKAALGKNMTVEACVALCSSKAYVYAGAEDGRLCSCGNALYGGGNGTVSECNVNCRGNSTEICGGLSRISLYYNGPGTPVVKNDRTPRRLVRRGRGLLSLFV